MGRQWETTIYVVYDDRNLYIACRAPDLTPTKITGHDAKEIWNHDGIEIMLDTNLNRWSYYHFLVNATGAFGDIYYPNPGLRDNNTFNLKDYTVAGSAERGVIEVRIPFAAFNNHREKTDPNVPTPPKPGTVWGANFIRNEHDEKQHASWAYIRKVSSHKPHLFNAITFTGKRK